MLQLEVTMSLLQQSTLPEQSPGYEALHRLFVSAILQDLGECSGDAFEQQVQHLRTACPAGLYPTLLCLDSLVAVKVQVATDRPCSAAVEAGESQCPAQTRLLATGVPEPAYTIWILSGRYAHCCCSHIVSSAPS